MRSTTSFLVLLLFSYTSCYRFMKKGVELKYHAMKPKCLYSYLHISNSHIETMKNCIFLSFVKVNIFVNNANIIVLPPPLPALPTLYVHFAIVQFKKIIDYSKKLFYSSHCLNLTNLFSFCL